MPLYLYAQFGTVIEIHPRHKAIVEFRANMAGSNQRAVLWSHRYITTNGQPISEEDNITSHLSIGDELRFDCHKYGTGDVAIATSQPPDARWYISRAVHVSTNLSLASAPCNITGRVDDLTSSWGVLSFTLEGAVHDDSAATTASADGADSQTHRAVFLSTDVHMFGAKLSADTSLLQVLIEGELVQCDAFRCDEVCLQGGAKWYAPLVWKGPKPLVGKTKNFSLPESLVVSEDLVTESMTARPSLTFYDMFCERSQPIKQLVDSDNEQGHVMSILDSNNALLLWKSAKRCMDVVAFRSDQLFLDGQCLKGTDLTSVLEQGDRLYFTLREPYVPHQMCYYAERVWL